MFGRMLAYMNEDALPDKTILEGFPDEEFERPPEFLTVQQDEES